MSDVAQIEPEFLIQTRIEPIGGVRLEGAGDFAITGSKKQLIAAAAVAEKAGDAMHGVFQKLAPTSGSVAFSITFTAETGVPMIAKGSGSGTLTVTLEWAKDTQ